MSFLNSLGSVFARLRQQMRSTTDDSERIRILPASEGAHRGDHNATIITTPPAEASAATGYHQESALPTRRISSSCEITSSSTSLENSRGRLTRDGNRHQCGDDDIKHQGFYNSAFSLCPSDLEGSWSTSMKNGDAVCNGKSGHRISVHRDPLDHSYIGRQYGILPSETASEKVSRYVRSNCTCSFACLISFITSIFPFLSWLPKYRLDYLLPDVIAGFTIVILHIPQGMAYGILATLKAENGLYVSFFPVLVYFLLGSSRHISIGTFAVISLMLSSTISNIQAVTHRNVTGVVNGTETPATNDWPPTHLEVATSVCIAVGFWQLFMGVFKLGSLTVVLSDQLVSGFSTGAAVHVALSQVKDLFGIRVGRYSGPLKLVYMIQDVLKSLPDTNGATVIISAIAIFTLAVFKEQIEKRLKGKLKMPIPIDLIVVVLATVASYFGKFHETYNVSIMKSIPTGLPAPVPPRLDLIPKVIPDSFAIAMVAFAISLSMAKLFAKKHKYPVDPNQELFALGCANVFSSFFACYPCSASLSRSLMQERAGGKTQVAGLVSCGIMLLVLLALAPLFYTLPKCILSCVILVALKGMFMQVKDFTKAWKISKLDALIWLVTFWGTALLDVSYGLLVGVIFSILTVIFRTALPSRTFLGRIPNTDIYLDARRYNLAQEVKGIKIFHFDSSLYFMNREIFKSSLQKHVPLDMKTSDEESKADEHIHRIIIDCSTFSFIDMSGLETLLEIMREYKEAGISVFLSGCSIPMYDVMNRSRFLENVPQHPAIFPTIHDAVQFHYVPSPPDNNNS